jgi:hypothetical protein
MRRFFWESCGYIIPALLKRKYIPLFCKEGLGENKI